MNERIAHRAARGIVDDERDRDHVRKWKPGECFDRGKGQNGE